MTSEGRGVVFLFSWPLSPRDVERFGFEELRAKGLRVRVFSLCQLLNAEAAVRFPVDERLRGDYIEEFSNWGEFDRAVAAAARNSVFVDYLLGLAYLDPQHCRAFRILAKHRARYYILVTSLPSPEATISGRIKKAFDAPKLARFAATRILALLRRVTGRWALPRRIFGAPTGRVDAYVRRYGLPEDAIVPSHTLDYDVFLRHRRFPGDLSPDGTCVFIDEAATHHPDAALVGGENLGPERYFRTMQALFAEVERQTSLRVVIAAHPRSRYEDMPGVFGEREIVRGATLRLIERSSLVISHASTALGFAVLLRKPVLLVKTGEMTGARYGELVDSMGKALGLGVAALEDVESVRRLRLRPLPALGTRYDEYRDRYVQTPSVPDVTIWELVAERALVETLRD